MSSATSPVLTIRTNITPPISVNPLSKSDVPLHLKPLFAFLQPTIDGDFGLIGKVHYAPEGTATELGGIVFFILIALAVYGAYNVGKKLL